MAKKEIRVFVSDEINEWLEGKAEEGIMGNSKSEVVRSYLRDIYRGVFPSIYLKGESEEGKSKLIANLAELGKKEIEGSKNE